MVKPPHNFFLFPNDPLLVHQPFFLEEFLFSGTTIPFVSDEGLSISLLPPIPPFFFSKLFHFVSCALDLLLKRACPSNFFFFHIVQFFFPLGCIPPSCFYNPIWMPALLPPPISFWPTGSVGRPCTFLRLYLFFFVNLLLLGPLSPLQSILLTALPLVPPLYVFTGFKPPLSCVTGFICPAFFLVRPFCYHFEFPG